MVQSSAMGFRGGEGSMAYRASSSADDPVKRERLGNSIRAAGSRRQRLRLDALLAVGGSGGGDM